MPTYEYKCPKCQHEFEVIQKITAKSGAKCPRCGARAERQLSAAGLVFKGSGFYITDYKRAGEQNPEHEAKPEAKPDAKPEAKPDAKPEAKPEAKSGAKPEARSDSSKSKSKKPKDD